MKRIASVLWLPLALVAGCAASEAAQPVRVESPAPTPDAAPATDMAKPTRPLLPLTADERQLEKELRQLVAELSAVGERNVAHPLALADATDWIVTQAGAHGVEVRRQGFFVGEEVVQNLVVHVPGLRRGDHSVVVGARLDSPAGAGGGDDNASGVAALLCLAKRFVGKRALRSVDFVWFADGSGRQRPDGLGTRVFLDEIKKEKRTITAMIELHGLGAFSDAPDSQGPISGQPTADSVARFIAVSTYPQHANVSDHFYDAFADAATLPVVRFVTLSDGSQDDGQSIHSTFLAAGYPALLVHDTQAARYADWGGPRDTAERLDYERMARVVAALEAGLLSLAGPLGDAPTMGAEPEPGPTANPSNPAGNAGPAPHQSAGGGASQ